MSLHSSHDAHAYDDCQSRLDAVDSQSIGFQFGKLLFLVPFVCYASLCGSFARVMLSKK